MSSGAGKADSSPLEDFVSHCMTIGAYDLANRGRLEDGRLRITDVSGGQHLPGPLQNDECSATFYSSDQAEPLTGNELVARVELAAERRSLLWRNNPKLICIFGELALRRAASIPGALPNIVNLCRRHPGLELYIIPRETTITPVRYPFTIYDAVPTSNKPEVVYIEHSQSVEESPQVIAAHRDVAKQARSLALDHERSLALVRSLMRTRRRS